MTDFGINAYVESKFRKIIIGKLDKQGRNNNMILTLQRLVVIDFKKVLPL
jgi:hypothetical protein